ncbi:MAG: hypothetical protein AAGH60_09470 [Pseudomonadota bacterium]
MSLTLITAVLSGLLFGALAAALRRFVLLIVTLPVLIAPFGYAFHFKDAIDMSCLYASRFGTQACAATSGFVEQTVLGLPTAALFASVHVAVGVGLALSLMMTRLTINHIFKHADKDNAASRFSLPDDPMAEITIDELIFRDEGSPKPAAQAS